jgi:hypothetical protein
MGVKKQGGQILVLRNPLILLVGREAIEFVR